MTDAARTPLPTRPRTRGAGGGRLLGMIALRLAGIVAVLFVLSIVVFALMHLAPGDLAKTLLGTRSATPEAIAAIREQYHLDDPIVAQYLNWLGGVLAGDWGTSIRLQIPVVDAIGARIGVTFWLCALAFLLAAAVAIPLGIRAAVRPGGPLDRFGTWSAIIGISAPTFAVGVLLLYVFAYFIPIFPVYGAGDGGFASMLYHLVLPAASMAIGLGAILLKLTRTAMLGALGSDYITAMRARGIPESRVERVALRNAAIPIVTAASLLRTFFAGGTLLAETVFALPGLGKLLSDSVLYKDIPVVQGATLLIAAVIALIALLADLSYLVLDPRVRQREGRR